MKKTYELIRPYLSVVFGALFFLCFFNSLQYQGAALATGIIAVIFSAYYLCSGILDIVMGDKLPENIKKIFGLLNACLFPVFLFIMTLIGVIDSADMMGPNGWAIEIVQLVVFIAFPMMYLFSFLTKGETLIVKLTRVFALLFVLSLLLDLLFSELGAPTTLADIPLVYLALYGIFANLVFAYLPKVEVKEESSAEAEPVEDAQEEPAEE